MRNQAILDYWFGDLSDDKPIDKKSSAYRRWFSGGRQVDEEIRVNFEADLKKAAAGGYTEWEEAPRGRLALIILFDQMTRNMYRGTPQMFAFDPLALSLTLRSLKDGMDQSLSLIERQFMYMPLMHSEDLKNQELSLQKFTQLVEDSREKSPHSTLYYDNSRDYAQRHWTIIVQFGRFPHRNKILGRPSTAQEQEFLQTPGSSF